MDVLMGRYALVKYGAMPGAIVFNEDGSDAVHVSQLRITFEDGRTVVSMVDPVEICHGWDAGIAAADKIASEQGVDHV